MTDIRAWLEGELQARGMTLADLARATGINSGTLSNMMSRNAIGDENARRIAAALHLPEAEVFYATGLLSQRPGEVIPADPVLADIWRMLIEMTDEERIAARVLFERFFGKAE